MKKILIIAALALVAGFYFWPEKTEKGVQKTVAGVVSAGTGALKGATASAKQAINN